VPANIAIYSNGELRYWKWMEGHFSKKNLCLRKNMPVNTVHSPIPWLRNDHE